MLPFVVPLALAAPALSRDVGGWRLLTQARGTLRVRPMRTAGGRVQVSLPIATRTFAFGHEGQPPEAVTSSTGRSVAISVDREPGLDLIVADSRTLATRRRARLNIDARASWSPEDEFVVLYKSYGYGAGHLSLLDPKTGSARRVSDDADFVWWAGPRQAILVGTPLYADDPLVQGVFVRRATPKAVYGVPADLSDASRGKIVTPEGTLYSSQGRYGAYCPMSEVASIPGFEGVHDTVWTKARGSRQYPPALPADSNRVVSVWTSPNRLLTAVTGTSSPTIAIQGLEAGIARYRVIGLGQGESIVGFIHD